MPSLLSDCALRTAHMQMEGNQTLEHPVATLLAALQRVYLHEPTIINAAEKPPADDPVYRRRRVDSVTHWCVPGSNALPISAVWEVKKPNATPREIEICEGQVFDACQSNLRNYASGTCYGFSGIGSFWRVFVFEKPGSHYKCLTGEGPSTLASYVDISDATDESEAILFDSCLRDLREFMG
jgi:hypothetical protein